MPYHYITHEERVKIEAWKKVGETNGDIAKLLGRSRSSIGRELSRNEEQYHAGRAEKRRKNVRRKANEKLRKLVPGYALANKIEEGIKKYWSPEQVLGRIQKKQKDLSSVMKLASPPFFGHIF